MEEEKKGTKLTKFWTERIRELKEKGEAEEKKVRDVEEIYEESEEEIEETRRRPFFDCEEDKFITERNDIVRAQESTTSRCMIHVRAHLGMSVDKVFYTTQNGLIVAKRGGEEWGKVVAPECIRAHILEIFHSADLAGHQGERRTLGQIQMYFFWPGMKKQVFRWVKACLGCRKRKTPRPMRAGITEAQLATYANEVVAMDFLGPFPRSINGNRYIFTMIDIFTRWPVAIPVPDRLSLTVAKSIFKFWICEKGVPLKIVSDRALEFLSRGIKQLAAYMGTILIATGGYNPAGNSSVERFHRYLNASLCIIYDKVDSDWDEYVPAVLFSYRASKNDTTGILPILLRARQRTPTPLRKFVPLHAKESRTGKFCERNYGKFRQSLWKSKETAKSSGR